MNIFEHIQNNPRFKNEDNFFVLPEDNYVPLPCPSPTQTTPGTKARLAIYIRRLELGQELFHPEDKVLKLSKADIAWTKAKAANRVPFIK